MKICPGTLLLFLTCIIMGRISNAQLTVNDSLSPDQLVSNIVGQGITVSNVSFKGNPLSIGNFQGTSSNLGLNLGVLLTTGASLSAASKASFNGVWSQSEIVNPALKSIVPASRLYDESSLSFDFTPCTDRIQLRFVLGSDDYNEYVEGGFDDVLGIFITSKGEDGLNYSNRNIALVPGTDLPVKVNNVNNGYAAQHSIPTGPCKNCEFYKGNISDQSLRTVQYNGLTVPLFAEIAVVPGQPYSIQIAIADVGDPTYDSGIFIESGSFMAVAPVATASKVCLGGALNLTASGGGSSYLWTGPNGFNATLQNPLLTDITGAASGAYSVKIAYSPGCESVAIVNVAVQSSACCANSLRKNIGGYGKVTTFSGGATFSGNYVVNGDLEFNTGTYNFLPNTIFYFRNNTGLKVGTDGVLNIEGATLTSSCDAIWNGIELTSNGKIFTSASKSLSGALLKRSEISNCKNAIAFTNSLENSLPIQYTIDNTDFVNFYATAIESNRFSTCNSCYVSNATFSVDPYYMKSMFSIAYPERSFSGDFYLGNKAIVYAGPSALTVTNSTFSNLLYGIFSPASSGNLVASGNSATNIYKSFIKTPNLYGGTINNNTVELSTGKVSSSQDDLNSSTGIDIDGSAITIYNNIVSAKNVDFQRLLTGINISDGLLTSSNKVYGNTISYMNVGISLTLRNSLNTGLDVYNNSLNTNARGIVVRQLIDDPRQGKANIFCNSFTNTARLAGLQGIAVESDRFLNDQGSPGNPVGNSFVDIAAPLANVPGNAAFVYYYGPNEVAPLISGSVILAVSDVPSACSKSGYSNGNGREGATVSVAESVVSASLSELIPNPANDVVSFRVRIPAQITVAKIIIYSTTEGKIGELNVSSSDTSKRSVDVSNYNPGLYFYSLVIDGEVVESKRLMIVR